MEHLSESENRALDAQCGSATSTHSRRAVVKLRAMSSDDKASCMKEYAAYDFVNLARCALAAGISPDTIWGEDRLPVICMAAEEGSQRVLRVLLAAGANPGLADAVRSTAVHKAAYFGHVACLRLLIEAGVQLDEEQGGEGMPGGSPLTLAAKEGHFEVCQVLLSAGASLATVSSDTLDTPLHLATHFGRVAVINLFAAGGADIEARGHNGRTPLAVAASRGHAEAVAALLSHGANPNALNRRGETALMDAIMHKQTSCVAALLPVSDLSITRANGYNAFHTCVSTANEECFQLLLPHVSDVDAPTVRVANDDTCFNQSALHIACQKGQHRMAKALLRRGASRMARDSLQRTPLHLAAISGQLSCLVHVLGSPGNYKLTPEEVNAKNVSGRTPLHAASQNGRTHCCGALLAAGARLDDDATDESGGVTPLMVAQVQHPENAELHALLSGRGPADAPGTTCNHCSAREAETRLRACSGCYSVRYCSAACSKAAWPAHKPECLMRQAERERCTKAHAMMFAYY